MYNKYIKRSRISEAKFREFIRYFSLDLDAHKIAFLTGLNRNTVNRYLLLIRKRIAEFCERSSPFSGEIRIDRIILGARHIEGKRGHGALVKRPSSASFSVAARFIQRSFLRLCPERPCKPVVRGGDRYRLRFLARVQWFG